MSLDQRPTLWANGPTCRSQGQAKRRPWYTDRLQRSKPCKGDLHSLEPLEKLFREWLTNSLDRARLFWHTRPQPTRPEDSRGFNGRVVTCPWFTVAPSRCGPSGAGRCRARSHQVPRLTSPPKLLGRARPGQSKRRAECWRCGVDGGPFGWKPGPGDPSVDSSECLGKRLRHEGPQDTEVAPAATASRS